MQIETILNALVMIAIIVTAVYAVMAKNVMNSVIALGVTGGFVSLAFIILHAPDVAIAEAAVGAVLSTAIFVIAVRKTTKKGDEDKNNED
ncbi:MAG: DUF4040 domain-containing protein [Lachnospiraceae bacterium]|nr:DUF4040 domain-containing protein [Lachnospiraceae bacterium]